MVVDRHHFLQFACLSAGGRARRPDSEGGEYDHKRDLNEPFHYASFNKTLINAI
jgi:hypothetical protein